jgi:prepilin-type N-terminal cleavage/methylation domain-containing protein
MHVFPGFRDTRVFPKGEVMEKGFTLLEIMIVVALIGLWAGIFVEMVGPLEESIMEQAEAMFQQYPLPDELLNK